MGDENPIRTLGDYSKPSHEGYKNTIELPIGNNVVPLRSDTIRLVQNRCSFHRLRSEDPNQHLKDFLKLVDSLNLDSENRERTCLRSITTCEDFTTRFLAQFFPPGRTAKLQNDSLMFQQHHGESLSEAWTHFKDLLQKVPHYGIDLWLQVQIFYDHVNPVTRQTIDQSVGGKIRDLNDEESWALLEDLSLYDNEIQCLMEAHLAPSQPTQVKKITTSCEICSSPHDSRYYMKDPEQAFVEYASSRTDKVGGKWYEPLHKGVTFRLGGVEREISLLELGWRVRLYSERESRDVATLSGLRRVETVNSTHLTYLFWPSIGDDRRNTNRVTEIDLFYLYCIFGEEVVCNIPYWLAKYLKGIRDKVVIFRGMFVTKIAWSFGLLTEEMVSVLNREPPPHVYRNKLLVKIGVIMKLHEGEYCWPVTRGVVKEDGGDDEEG
ncbi:MAK10-like protein [Tanacetum coccineum]